MMQKSCVLLNSSLRTSKLEKRVPEVERGEPPVCVDSGCSLRSTPGNHYSDAPNLEVLSLD